MGRNCILLFALAVFILLHHHTSLTFVPNISTDEAALLALKSHISSHPNKKLVFFRPCLQLDRNHLQLPSPTITTLSTRFATRFGSFAEVEIGEIPSSLSNLTKLQVLRIQNNFLQGEIPREIGDLRYLTILDLQVNKLTGSIPTSIFNITTLQNVALTENNLTGNLPITICDHLPNLEGLHLSVNYLIGVIPPNLDKCRKLQILSLTYNEFIGTVPRELSNLTDLTEQYIAALQLKGGIPVELGNLKKLQRLALSRNDLTGFVPASIFNMSTLQFLALSENKLSGTLPSNLGRGMPILEELYCAQNNLSGFFSASISNSSKLRILDLSVNSFTGPIPESLGNLEYLKHLNFAGNNFFSDTTFRSLTSLTNCRNLRVLVFGGNQLDIILPTSVGNFSNSLKIFEAPACNLKGVIPKEIGNLTGLIHMSLQYNELTGHVPNTIQGMLNLQEFYLQSNKIEGTIPDAICNLKNLGALYLSGNQFSGSVPPCLGNVTSLRYLYIGYNMLNSILPESLGGLRDLLEFNISSNLLGGKIPLEIGNLKAATLIDLSKNNFSGKIPSTLGGLDKLINLSLAHNILDGPIPDSFDKLLALEFLDLCYNNIGGEIPKSLEALVYLKYLNFSFNKLSGEIPTGGPFENATGQSFLSNDALCGDSKFNVSPCVIQSSKRKKTILILCIILGVGLLFVVLALAYIFVRFQKTKKNKGQADVSPAKGHERISYYELEQATEGFNESNLLGNGSFSMVYKRILKDGTIFAAKVFNVQLEGAFKSFDTECEILRNLRHRNLTKVITSCSNLDFKALVLEYMPNGTLDKWLYSHNLFFDLLQRLDIMIDVASAMDYLHNGYSMPVVHCDLKPSNVLLDQEMVGHVSDFGISKLLGAGEAFVQTRTIATIGYIAPEYGQDGIVSTSCDVYSFGILMMETFTRMRPTDEIFTGDLSIQLWVSNSFPSGIHKVVDSNLIESGDKQIDAKMQCLSSIMELALSCTLVTPDARISMEDALLTLKKIRLRFVGSLY
ncbi:hypothetical protein MTR67_025492 [Solanum verrucosum]|uniref:non-specific serine/threonine protein kinase n=1 Tax=Solanum verrucosum TaxID=315347 RepID=A0AAF0TT56_SOLVR|nr:hypothetical protein MTR67_025492 [Solanum verrucosum]